MKTFNYLSRNFQIRMTLMLVSAMMLIIAVDNMTISWPFITRVAVVFLSSTVLALLFGKVIARGITRPIRRLVKGTRQIGKEKFMRIPVEGTPEIKELAQSFNEMAFSLYKSRRRLNTYFYRVIHSLVRIMEARDQNTIGHSERVADYTARLAVRLGLPPGEVELLRETAVLHDVGKLGIEERILHKTERLTDKEWDAIRRHPVIGEEILAPILLNKELISIIRSHHERHDGNGYPDKLAGQQIKLFAQILSVADSYDAMTSPRSYRPAMGKQKALEEIAKNKGTQFSPHIVDMFIKMIAEEDIAGKGAE